MFTHTLLLLNNLWEMVLQQQFHNPNNFDTDMLRLWCEYFAVSGAELRCVRHSIIEFLYTHCFVHPLQRVTMLQKVAQLLESLLPQYVEQVPETSPQLGARSTHIRLCMEDCIFVMWVHLLRIDVTVSTCDDNSTEDPAAVHGRIVHTLYRKSLINDVLPALVQVYQFSQQYRATNTIRILTLMVF
uniref:Uncharacterized protein n=1 Tax=Lygus hesperus TaxID=30085 RepID=A0A0A9Z5J0_LYGHE